MNRSIASLSKILIAAFFGLGSAHFAIAQNQIVNFSSTEISFSGVGENVTVGLDYDVSDGEKELSGLNFRVHFDSSKVDFVSVPVFNDFGAAITGEPESALDDETDDDGDASTDKYLQFSWADFNISWPGESETLPVRLADVTFVSNNGLNDGPTILRVSVVDSAPGYGFESNTATVLQLGPPLAAPSFTLHPSSQGVTAPVGVTLTALATGNPAPTYQWRKGGADLPGETGTSLTIDPTDVSDAGSYDVVATNSEGGATSDVATLTVDPSLASPVFTLHPSSQGVTAPAGVTFDALAIGNPPPSYQWRKGGADLPGETGPSLTIDPTSVADSGSYDVVATNSEGSVVSDPATLTVEPPLEAPSFTLHPSIQTVTAPAGVTLNALATGNPTPSYQWRRGGVDITGETGASLTIDPTSVSDADSYDVVATNSEGTDTSNAATLTVDPPLESPAVSINPPSDSVIEPAGVTFTAVVTGNPAPTLQWLKDGVELIGETGSSLIIDSTTAENSGSYQVVATNSEGSATSGTATLTVEPLVRVISLSGDFSFGNVKVGENSPSRTLTISTGGNDDLTVTGISTPSGYASNFEQPLIVPVNGSANVEVTFSPELPQLYTGEIVVVSNATSGDNTASVSGTGLPLRPKIFVSFENTEIPNGDGSPSAEKGTEFGSTDITIGGEQRIFRVKNMGDSDLILGTPSSNNGHFHISGLASAVSAGESDEFTVTFNPTLTGIERALISIPNNDENPFSFEVSGVGTGIIVPAVRFYENWEGYDLGTGIPSPWLPRDSWGDIGLIEVVSDPVNEGARAIKVKGQPSWVQGLYRTDTFQEEDAKLSLEAYLPSGTAIGQPIGAFAYGGLNVNFFAETENTFEARISSPDGNVILPGLPADEWISILLEYDWDTRLARMSTGETSRTVALDELIETSGWGIDLSLWGNNRPLEESNNTIYFDELKIQAMDVNLLDLLTDLFAWYPLDGDADDYSGNDRHGTNNGAIPVSDRDGNLDSAFSFDGTDDFIQATGIDFDSDEVTVSMWLYATDLPVWYRQAFALHSGETGFSNRGDKGIVNTLQTSGNFNFNYEASNAGSTDGVQVVPFNPETWYHVAFTRSGQTKKLYVNGALVESKDDSLGSLIISDGLLEIGAPNFWGSGDGWQQNGRDTAKWKGKIDDVRIYTRALNLAEVEELSVNAPEIAVDYNSSEIAYASTPSDVNGTDFGSEDITAGGIQRIFRIRNIGESVLNLGTPSSNNAQFTVSGLASSIPAGESDEFTVSFEATSTGAHDAMISFSYGTGGENLFRFNVSGERTAMANENPAKPGVMLIEWPEGIVPESGARLERREVGSDDWEVVADIDKDTASFEDGTIGRGKHYEYQLAFSVGETLSTLSVQAQAALPFDETFYSITVQTQATLRSRLANISTRGLLGSGDNSLILGFTIQGTGEICLLTRVQGPELGLSPGFDMIPTATDPVSILQETVYSTNPISFVDVANNDDWGDDQLNEIKALFSPRTFALPNSDDDSADSAMALKLEGTRVHTVVAEDAGEPEGLALVEVFDATEASPNDAQNRLVNLSTRGFVGTGDNILIGGFIVDGLVDMNLLIRAVGPDLIPRGLSGALLDPQITLINQLTGDTIAFNDDWEDASNSEEVIAITTQVGATNFQMDSKDAVLLLNVDPGLYTFKVEGVDGATGIGLIEVFLAD